MEGILPEAVQWRAGKGDLSPNLHSCLRAADRPSILAALKDPALADYVHAEVLEAVQRRYFEGPDQGFADADAGRLLRTAVLAVWLSKSGRAVEE
jgi:hypothetical protein